MEKNAAETSSLKLDNGDDIDCYGQAMERHAVTAPFRVDGSRIHECHPAGMHRGLQIAANVIQGEWKT